MYLILHSQLIGTRKNICKASGFSKLLRSGKMCWVFVLGGFRIADAWCFLLFFWFFFSRTSTWLGQSLTPTFQITMCFQGFQCFLTRCPLLGWVPLIYHIQWLSMWNLCSACDPSSEGLVSSESFGDLTPTNPTLMLSASLGADLSRDRNRDLHVPRRHRETGVRGKRLKLPLHWRLGVIMIPSITVKAPRLRSFPYLCLVLSLNSLSDYWRTHF